jgi:ABC-2 type transport system permease protein
MQSVQDGMDRGKIYAAVVVPPDFSQRVASSTLQPTLQVLLNGAEVIPATAALRAIEGVANQISERILIRRLGMTPNDFAGFEPSMRMWFNETLSEAFYSTPAELALMLEFTVLLFAALSFSRERELGTLEQLLVMPFTSFEIIVGKALPVIIIGYVDFLLMLGVVHFGFGVPVRGSLALLLALAFGYILVELGKGMVISVISRTQHQAFLLVIIYTGPTLVEYSTGHYAQRSRLGCPLAEFACAHAFGYCDYRFFMAFCSPCIELRFMDVC